MMDSRLETPRPPLVRSGWFGVCKLALCRSTLCQHHPPLNSGIQVLGMFQPLNRTTQEKTTHRLFEIIVLFKGVDGILEIIGGSLLLFMSPRVLNATIFFLTAHELSEDPHDLIANLLRHSVQSLSSDTQLFASVYLLVHGLIKVFLVAGLLRDRLWAYPTALWFLGIFIAYMLYRFTHTHSLFLLLLSIFDFVVVYFIWREYQFRKKRA